MISSLKRGPTTEAEPSVKHRGNRDPEFSCSTLQVLLPRPLHRFLLDLTGDDDRTVSVTQSRNMVEAGPKALRIQLPEPLWVTTVIRALYEWPTIQEKEHRSTLRRLNEAAERRTLARATIWQGNCDAADH